MSKYTVRIAFLNVGQGDTIVISIPETKEALVVDCIEAEGVLAYFEQEKIKHFRGLILTHLHADHYEGAVQLLDSSEKQGLPCERVLFNWPPTTTQQALDLYLKDEDGHDNISPNAKIKKIKRKSVFEDFKRWTTNNDENCGTLIRECNDGRLTRLRGTMVDQLELFHPNHVNTPNLTLNNASVVLKVSGLNSNALLTGDLELQGFNVLSQNKGVNLQADVLKFPHHGAWKGADPVDLLDKINPSIVVISVGTEGSKYQHPNMNVFQAIAKRPQTHLLCTQVTDQCTTIIPQSDTIKQSLKSDNVNFSFDSQLGCPCAGTVIVELGQTAQLIQPKKVVHQQIIRTYFNKHQCNLAY